MCFCLVCILPYALFNFAAKKNKNIIPRKNALKTFLTSSLSSKYSKLNTYVTLSPRKISASGKLFKMCLLPNMYWPQNANSDVPNSALCDLSRWCSQCLSPILTNNIKITTIYTTVHYTNCGTVLGIRAADSTHVDTRLNSGRVSFWKFQAARIFERLNACPWSPEAQRECLRFHDVS